MTIGAGKFDGVATLVRNVTGARGVVVIIFDGIRGSGFSAQLPDAAHHRPMVKALRAVLEQMERDLGITAASGAAGDAPAQGAPDAGRKDR